MTTLDIAIVCATQLAVAYIVGERWYVHRDRAVQRMSEGAQATMTLVREETLRMTSEARTQVQDAFMAARAEQEKRIATLEAEVASQDRVIKTRMLGGRS